MNRKYALQETVKALGEIDQLATALGLYSNNWLRMNIKNRPLGDVLEDLRQQAQQQGLAAAA